MLIKTRQMETERGKRLFSTLSQRCLNQSHVCNQNRSGDSYLLVPEFKAPEVRQQNRVYFLCKHSHTSFSVTCCLILVYCDILFMADIISIPTPSLTLLFVLTFALALQPQKEAKQTVSFSLWCLIVLRYDENEAERNFRCVMF